MLEMFESLEHINYKSNFLSEVKVSLGLIVKHHGMKMGEWR
jgi:hypothetical protein